MPYREEERQFDADSARFRCDIWNPENVTYGLLGAVEIRFEDDRGDFLVVIDAGGDGYLDYPVFTHLDFLARGLRSKSVSRTPILGEGVDRLERREGDVFLDCFVTMLPEDRSAGLKGRDIRRVKCSWVTYQEALWSALREFVANASRMPQLSQEGTGAYKDTRKIVEYLERWDNNPFVSSE